MGLVAGLVGGIVSAVVKAVEDARDRRMMREVKRAMIGDALSTLRHLVTAYADAVSEPPTPTQAPAMPVHQPAPPERVDLGDGKIAYVAESEIIPPGRATTVNVGVGRRVPGTGFAGVLESMARRFGVAERFKPNVVELPAGFALRVMYAGADNMFFSHAPIPADKLSQPYNYGVCPEGLAISVEIHNLTDKPASARVILWGEAAPEVE
jgi:hypothetical protein